MAVNITSNYNGTTDDGTVVSDSVITTITGDVNQPMRYQCTVGTSAEMVLDYSTTKGFAQAEQGVTSYVRIVNRDDSNNCKIIVRGSGGTKTYTLILAPNEWHTIHGFDMSTGSGAVPTWENITQIDAQFDNAPGTIEITAINLA